jgi:murein DD-endopeptidase MepM/ murein hydrolase activator NlpD
VGVEGGKYKEKDCLSKVSSNSGDLGSADVYKRIGLYVEDYPLLGGYAWYSTASDDPEAEEIAREFGFDDDGGGGSSGSNSSSATVGNCANCEAAPNQVGWFAPLENFTEYRYGSYGGHGSASDINASTGTNVYAVHDGEIISAGNTGQTACSAAAAAVASFHSPSIAITMEVEGGYTVTYMHLESVNVSRGDTVNAGDFLGKTDNSGCSSGPHLHFQIDGPGVGATETCNTTTWLGYRNGCGGP